MGPKTTALIGVLEELVSVLESGGESLWSTWMLRAKSRLERSDYSGIEYLLSAYGGIGSFNDLVLCSLLDNGRIVQTPEYIQRNNHLDALRNEAWILLKQSSRTMK